MRAYEIFNEKGLAKGDLDSDTLRWSTFVNKINNNEMFIATGDWVLDADGKEDTRKTKYTIQLVPLEKTEYWANKHEGSATLPQATIQDYKDFVSTKQKFDAVVNGQTGKIALSKLQKTREFGSVPISTKVEDTALGALGKMFAKLKGENKEVEIIIGDKKVMAAKFVSTPKLCNGDCKADFHVEDASGKQVAWISHKKYDETKRDKEGYSHAADFIGWGGLSDRLMKDVYDTNPKLKDEIRKFASDVKELYSPASESEEYHITTSSKGNEQVSSLPKGLWVYRKLKNGIMRAYSIYGIEFGGDRGLQNVDLVLQGDPYFDENNKLMAKGSTHSNGERLENDYEPVVTAFWRPSRPSATIQDITFRGVRFAVYPVAAITQRPGDIKEI